MSSRAYHGIEKLDKIQVYFLLLLFDVKGEFFTSVYIEKTVTLFGLSRSGRRLELYRKEFMSRSCTFIMLTGVDLGWELSLTLVLNIHDDILCQVIYSLKTDLQSQNKNMPPDIYS